MTEDQIPEDSEMNLNEIHEIFGKWLYRLKYTEDIKYDAIHFLDNVEKGGLKVFRIEYWVLYYIGYII